MFVHAKQATLIFSADRKRNISIPNGYLGEIPDWATKTKHFNQLVKCGALIVTGKTDAEIQAATDEKPRRRVKPENEE